MQDSPLTYLQEIWQGVVSHPNKNIKVGNRLPGFRLRPNFKTRVRLIS